MLDLEKKTDEELMELYEENSEEILSFLMEKYKPLVRKRARDLFLIGGEKEDLIQEGMIGLLKAVQNYKDQFQTSFYTFADLCISRQIYTAIKSSNSMKHRPLNEYVSIYSGENDGELWGRRNALTQESPESQILAQENAKDLQQLIQKKLSKTEREVMLLHIADYDYQQIAAILNISVKAVDNALQRGRKKLVNILEPV